MTRWLRQVDWPPILGMAACLVGLAICQVLWCWGGTCGP